MIHRTVRHPAGWLATSVLTVAAALAGVAPVAGQEVALVHEAGDRIRVAGMPVREFASGLRMETLAGEEGAYPDVCFVALVDSQGNVWEEYVSEPFRSGEGELDNACVPRFPVLPTGMFPDFSLQVPLVEGVGSEAFFGGAVDWEFLIKELDTAAPDLQQIGIKGESWYAEGYTQLQPPPHMEGVEYDWVALFFVVGPSEDRVASNVGLQWSTRPIMILVGAR